MQAVAIAAEMCQRTGLAESRVLAESGLARPGPHPISHRVAAVKEEMESVITG